MKHSPHFDVIVIGGGHAGVEAAMIASKLDSNVGLITIDKKALGRMSCNPAIGGLAKGQMVREMDVLGGVMGQVADRAALQFKMLNRSKGHAVWSPRAQVDKREYERLIFSMVTSNDFITVIEGEAIGLSLYSGKISAVTLRDGTKFGCDSVIITCGTFLNGLIHIGDKKIKAGRMGENHTRGITESLVDLGFKSGRLKTGTPPRLDRSSVDWSKTAPFFGDSRPTYFSYFTDDRSNPNVPCYTTNTNENCHDIIKNNLHSSPMFSGDIHGAGPRYCPSIEDKIHRFSHQSAHTLFLEPEWLGSDQIYTNGFSTSLPENVQLRAFRALPGLKHVRFMRPGYAIEYDFFPPAQLKSTLESKSVDGLFLAGQINGTSGYEEAGAQGLIAGINSVRFIHRKEPLVLKRNDAYIGVLIDDLITKDTMEPYRMFTSRAEYRILLRFSNADRRLFSISKRFNLLSNSQCVHIDRKLDYQSEVTASLSSTVLPKEVNPVLGELNQSTIKTSVSAKSILKRPGFSIKELPQRIFSDLLSNDLSSQIKDEANLETEAEIKYTGYIARQIKQINRLKNLEDLIIPPNFDYSKISGLSTESIDKLSFIRPETFGQAGRVSGVTPADLSILSIWVTERGSPNV